MKINAILFLLTIGILAFSMTCGLADGMADKADIEAGERFADQYFKSAPTTSAQISALDEVVENAPEMASGVPLFKLGAWYQIYIQSSSLFENVPNSPDQDMDHLQVEELWQIVVSKMKDAGLDPGTFSTLTNNPNIKSLAIDPYPDAKAAVEQDEKYQQQMAQIKLNAQQKIADIYSGIDPDAKEDDSIILVGKTRLPHPPYPPQALAAGKAGTVKLSVSFDGMGKVSSVVITQSSGERILDYSARDFVYANGKNPDLSGVTADVPISYYLSDTNAGPEKP